MTMMPPRRRSHRLRMLDRPPRSRRLSAARNPRLCLRQTPQRISTAPHPCGWMSVWIKADRLHTLIPRTTERWRSLCRNRVMVERGFGELKHEWAMLPLRVRRLSHVALHTDLTILARLASALAGARAVPLAA